nr:protein BASIC PENTACYSTEINE6-like [Ipomoea batatas]
MDNRTQHRRVRDAAVAEELLGPGKAEAQQEMHEMISAVAYDPLENLTNDPTNVTDPTPQTANPRKKINGCIGKQYSTQWQQGSMADRENSIIQRRIPILLRVPPERGETAATSREPIPAPPSLLVATSTPEPMAISPIIPTDRFAGRGRR